MSYKVRILNFFLYRFGITETDYIFDYKYLLISYKVSCRRNMD